jgi:hypothetical protein
MENVSKKGGAKAKSAAAPKVKTASVARPQPAKKEGRGSKPKPTAAKTSARKVSKYEQSGAPWWKQHLPE